MAGELTLEILKDRIEAFQPFPAVFLQTAPKTRGQTGALFGSAVRQCTYQPDQRITRLGPRQEIWIRAPEMPYFVVGQTCFGGMLRSMFRQILPKLGDSFLAMGIPGS